jgi:hypothetical protein
MARAVPLFLASRCWVLGWLMLRFDHRRVRQAPRVGGGRLYLLLGWQVERVIGGCSLIRERRDRRPTSGNDYTTPFD